MGNPFFKKRFFIDKFDSNIICLTEGYETLLPQDGYIISSNEDYGYATKNARKKVILWSKNKWPEENQIGSKEIPTGRFISGVTNGIKIMVFVSLGDLLMSVQGEKIVNHGRITSLLFKI